MKINQIINVFLKASIILCVSVDPFPYPILPIQSQKLIVLILQRESRRLSYADSFQQKRGEEYMEQ